MEELYINKRLSNNDNLDIVFLSHNAYWPQVESLKDKYDNCKVRVYGKGYSSLVMSNIDNMHSYNDMPISDADLIICYFNSLGTDDLLRIKALAHYISKEKNKIVTIGYSYYNPDYKEVDYHKEHIVKLIRIDNETTCEEEIIVLDLSPIDLVNYTLIKHDNVAYKKELK